MTIEEVLECSASQLEAMSDAELLKHFQQYLDVTRPERVAERKQTNNPKPHVQIYLSPAKKAAMAMLADEGVDLSFLNRRKK